MIVPQEISTPPTDLSFETPTEAEQQDILLLNELQSWHQTECSVIDPPQVNVCRNDLVKQ